VDLGQPEGVPFSRQILSNSISTVTPGLWNRPVEYPPVEFSGGVKRHDERPVGVAGTTGSSSPSHQTFIWRSKRSVPGHQSRASANPIPLVESPAGGDRASPSRELADAVAA